MPRKLRSWLTFERRLFLLALAGGAPATAFALSWIWFGGFRESLRWTATLLVAGCWLGCAASVREHLVHRLHTLANLLEALREGDYSLRARHARGEDALGEVMQQVNAMGVTMRQNRLGAMEATALLRKVMQEIDVAVFAFDQQQQLRLVNRAGEQLLAQPAERITGLPAAELGLQEFLEGEESQTRNCTFPGRAGRWSVRRSQFRERGLPHQLLVLTDLTLPLREEELRAWQRLVRVLGHELNNSLTPIKSIASSLGNILRRDPLPEDWREDVEHGLSIVSTRADSLNRFLGAYARLAKLPPPRLGPVSVKSWIEHAAALDQRLTVTVLPGPDIILEGDDDQLQQVLINLICNAIDASAETGGAVRVGWQTRHSNLEVWIEDEGHGVANPANLFVPFFTTKPHGSGIGLLLSRRIVEGHGGSLSLENRPGTSGCIARIVLPLHSAAMPVPQPEPLHS